jgi:ADP-heptose:LPS heptosyltransferase
LKEAEHLLILRFSALGDVAIMIPIIRCFLRQYSDVKLTIATNRKYIELFSEFDKINFISVEKSNKHNGFFGLFALFKELRTIKPTAVIDLHSVLRTNFLEILFRLFLFRFIRINKGRIEKFFITKKHNKKFAPLTPTIYRYLDVFRRTGYEVNIEKHEFPPLPILPKKISKSFKLKLKKWIGIAPFASFNGKVYPLDLMQKVIAYLQKENQVFLFGSGEREIKQLVIWENAYQNTYIASKELSLSEELTLMAYLDLMISMDSANGHLASNMGAKVLTIWGLTHPFLGFAPWGQPSTHNLTVDRNEFPYIPTSVYGNKVPFGYENVLRSISPKKIIEKSLEILSNQTSS